MSKRLLYALIVNCILMGVLYANNIRAQEIRSVKETRVTISFENADIHQIIRNIETLTDYQFSYKMKDLEKGFHLTGEFKNATVAEILLEISKHSPLKFKQVNNNIHISTKGILKKGESNLEIIIQGISITGKVTAAEGGEGLPGVNVIVKGTTQGTVTDVDGNYSLDVPGEESVLVFSSVGFIEEEVTVGNQTVIDMALTPDITALDEIVVIGYGVVKKSDLTGSVAQVSEAEIVAFPSAGVLQTLQGRAAGVTIQANNGDPGGTTRMRIRGGTSINASSDPLYVVDGFPGAALPQPEDIASIEILKDASSTAIYGSRGANGVVMITTKRGSSGKAQISLNIANSIQKEISRIDLLNAQQYTDLNNEAFGNPPSSVPDPIGTDWQDEIFRQGLIQNYQLSIAGGTGEVQYYVSGAFYDQKGVIINSNFQRFSLTSNLDIQATDKLKFGINLFARRTNKDGVATQEGSGGLRGGGVVSAALTTEPTLSVFDADGNYSVSLSGDPTDNAVAKAREREDETINDILQTNVFLEYEIIKGLKFRTSLGAITNSKRQGIYIPRTLLYGQTTNGEGTINGSKYFSLLNENYLSYNKSIENHDFTILGGYSYQSTRSETWRSGSSNYVSDRNSFWSLGKGTVFLQPQSQLTETELVSYFGRIDYKLKGKYLISLNARYDGASVFAKNNKWAFFPSVAVGWNIKDESFLRSIDVISQLKVRASYGLTGNQAIGPYQSLAVLRQVWSIQNNSIVSAFRPISVANDNLTWETTTQSDIGIELGLFNQRIVLEADFYNKVTNDLLFNMALPPHSGYSSFLTNIGKVENKGIDLTLSTVNIDGDFTWTSDINFSTFNNKVLELPEGSDQNYNVAPGHMIGVDATGILREGEAVGSFFGYVYDGVYQTGESFIPGDFDQFAGGQKYKDINGRDENGELTGEPDGMISEADRTIIGNPNPDFFWGFNNDFSFKNFDLNIFFVGSQGNDIFSFTLMELETMRGISNSTTEALKRWTPSNPSTTVPSSNSGRGYTSSSRWVFDGSYIRLRNIALGYNFNDVIGIQKVRIYASAQNLLTFTEYRGYDPEVNYQTGGGSAGNKNVGYDYASYPNAKSFTVGLNVTF